MLLAGAEIATLDLTLLMMAVGAVAGCLIAALGFNVVFQVLAAVIVAVALLAFVRPSIVTPPARRTDLQNGPAGAGRQERPGARAGHRARPAGSSCSGEVWSARTVDDSLTIEPGSEVGVAEIDGATAVVYPLT